MLPIQLPWMSGSFMPRKMSAICAGDLLPQLPCQERRSFCRCASLCTRVNSNSIPNTGEVPFPSRKFVSPASRTHFFSTTPDPHISGMNKKSLLRYSGPWAVSIGAKFQFQKDTFWKELLFFKESMKRWVSAVVSPVSEMPGKGPSRPQPQSGSFSVSSFGFKDLLSLESLSFSSYMASMQVQFIANCGGSVSIRDGQAPGVAENNFALEHERRIHKHTQTTCPKLLCLFLPVLTKPRHADKTHNDCNGNSSGDLLANSGTSLTTQALQVTVWIYMSHHHCSATCYADVLNMHVKYHAIGWKVAGLFPLTAR